MKERMFLKKVKENRFLLYKEQVKKPLKRKTLSFLIAKGKEVGKVKKS